ncbi:YbaK/EbsC family protein [Nesterenkonia natronophila]|uniref:YbaK/EbsC family protein n=1 Tax=Nesterenkonia natronophila TaxID=2174932 RepID=A0A3A4FHN2_9MICC|nr:YbaK/EbsC family protein [Nesterenkonia natronophila]RJN31805.1 YbaK/EbsC family protein [Nesterenkonia natronophila]
MAHHEHPAVARVLTDLAEYGLHPDVTWFDDAVTTAQSAADALGVEVGQIANSLVFTFNAGPILLLTSGAHRVDTDWLGEQLGGTVGRASKAVVLEATGQVIGGVAPVGHPKRVVTYVDPALADYREVWAAAGHPKTVFPTTFDQLLTVTGGAPQPVRPTS